MSLAEGARKRLYTIKAVAATGVTVLVVEQNVRGALLISDRALVMELVRKFMEGPAESSEPTHASAKPNLGGNIQQQPAA